MIHNPGSRKYHPEYEAEICKMSRPGCYAAGKGPSNLGSRSHFRRGDLPNCKFSTKNAVKPLRKTNGGSEHRSVQLSLSWRISKWAISMLALASPPPSSYTASRRSSSSSFSASPTLLPLRPPPPPTDIYIIGPDTSAGQVGEGEPVELVAVGPLESSLAGKRPVGGRERARDGRGGRSAHVQYITPLDPRGYNARPDQGSHDIRHCDRGSF